MKNWEYVTYQQAGKQQEVCRDYVKVHEDDGHLIACLCGELGSEHAANAAAAVTVETVVGLLSAVDTPEHVTKSSVKLIKETLTGEIQDRLAAFENEKGLPPGSLDCTLLFVCVFKQQNTAVIGNLGDSALCMIGANEARLFCDNAFSADGDGAVRSKDAAQRLNLTIARLDEDVLGFILASDGLEKEIYYKGLDCVDKRAELYFNSLLTREPQRVIRNRVRALTADADTSFCGDIGVVVVSRADAPAVVPENGAWQPAPAERQRENDLPAPPERNIKQKRQKKGGIPPVAWIFLLVGFFTGVAAGGLAAIIINSMAKPEQQPTTAPAVVQTDATRVTAPTGTAPQSTTAATQPTAASDAIIGTWTPKHFIVNNEEAPISEGWVATFTYRFGDNGVVTREVSGMTDEGTYRRDGKTVVVTFDGTDQKFVPGSDGTTMEVEIDSDGLRVRTVYEKSEGGAQQDGGSAEPAESSDQGDREASSELEQDEAEE